MRRSQPLRSRTALIRKTRLQVRRTLTSRPKPAVPGSVRLSLTARSGGHCEVMLSGCTGIASDPSHRITVKMGGRPGDAGTVHNRLSNLMHSCRVCHDWIHDNPRQAYEMGLMLREADDPSKVPVIYRGELSLLGDDGTVHNWEATGYVH